VLDPARHDQELPLVEPDVPIAELVDHLSANNQKELVLFLG
jgi:hypothetical protein